MTRISRFLSANRLQNLSKLSEQQLKLLAGDLRKLDRVESGLDRRALRWVVDGEDGDVLLDLAATKGGGQLLQLRCVRSSRQGDRSPRHELLGSFETQQAATALRLAQIYEAAARQGRRSFLLRWLGSPPWFEIFLREAVDLPEFVYCSSIIQLPSAVDARLLEGMLAADDQDTAFPARGALLGDPQESTARVLLTSLRDLGESISRHPQTVREALSRPAPAKVVALEVLHHAQVDIGPFAEELVELVVGTAKTVREAAEPLVRENRESTWPALKAKAVNGTGSERDHAVHLLWRLDAEAARPFLEERLEQNPSKKLRQTIRELLATRTGAAVDAAPETFVAGLELPPVPEIHPEAPLPKATRDALRELCELWNKETSAVYEKEKQRGNQYIDKPPTFSRLQADRAWEQLGFWTYYGNAKDSEKPDPLRFEWWWFSFDRRIEKFVERPELELIHFVRLMVLMRLLSPTLKRSTWEQDVMDVGVDHYARIYRRSHPPACGLRELAVAFRAAPRLGTSHHVGTSPRPPQRRQHAPPI